MNATKTIKPELTHKNIRDTKVNDTDMVKLLATDVTGKATGYALYNGKLVNVVRKAKTNSRIALPGSTAGGSYLVKTADLVGYVSL